MNEKKNTYVITVASGRIGRRVASKLLAAGHHVRVVGRDGGRLADLVARGATPLVGDIADVAFMTRAFDGADTALLIVKVPPTAPDFRAAFQDAAAVYAKAARGAGLPNALFISAMGAHDPSNTGLIQIHRDVEQVLDRVESLSVVHLRAASFIENLFYFLPAIRAAGAMATPIAPNAPVDWSTTAAVADAASAALLRLPFEKRRAIEVCMPRALTLAEIGSQISELLGRPFPAMLIPRQVNLPALIGAGLGADMAERMQTTWEIFSARSVREGDPATTVLCDSSVHDFLKLEFLPAYTAADRFELRLEYRVRDDVDLADFHRAVGSFVVALRDHRSDNVYTSYQWLDDPRRFLHVGSFAADAVTDLQQQPFFKQFTALLRERCVEPPDAKKLRAIASTTTAMSAG